MASIKMMLIALLVMAAFVVAPVYAGGETDSDTENRTGVYTPKEQDPKLNEHHPQQPDQEGERDEERDEWDEGEEEWEDDEEMEQPGQQE